MAALGRFKRLSAVLVAGALLMALAGCAGDTDPATGIRSTSAVLNGTGQCTGSEYGKWWFETRPYGGSWSSTGATHSFDCPSSTSATALPGVLATGLTPGIPHDFRVCTTLEGGSQGTGTDCADSNGTKGGTSYDKFTTRPYGESSPFNRTVPGGPAVEANSAAMVSQILTGTNSPDQLTIDEDPEWDYQHPRIYASASDPLRTIKLNPKKTEWVGNTHGETIRVPAGARWAGFSCSAPCAKPSDRHMAVVQPPDANGVVWEYDFHRVDGIQNGYVEADFGSKLRVDGDGRGGGSTVANFGLLAGTITSEELIRGKIDHALFAVVKCSSGKKAVYPANTTGGGFECENSAEREKAPTLGAHLWLDYTEAEIDALQIPAWRKTIIRAMAKYGAYFGDTGGSGFELLLDSPETYGAKNETDPAIAWAQQVGVPFVEGKYRMDIRTGVDWKNRLRVLQPPSETPPTDAPETRVTGGPWGVTQSDTAQFTFASEAGASFECKLDDGGSWTPCTSPKSYTIATTGDHEFQVRALRTAGSYTPGTYDATPAARDWEIVLNQAKPTAITDEATNVVGSEATLRGTVNPHGLSTQYKFEYGPTASYGTTVPTAGASAGSGGSPVAVQQTVGGLEAGATYHYRVLATNSKGTVYGEDRTFAVPSWSLQSTLDPQPKTEARLDDVSCPAADRCLAIARDDYLDKAIVQRWNGTSWSNTVSLPGVTLSGIACPSTTTCMLVGDGPEGGLDPRGWRLTEAFGSWSVAALTAPSPSGAADVRYDDVACSSTSACTAVGSYSASGVKPLAMRWNGTAWSIQTTPAPSGEEGSAGELLGLACGSASDCLAVGRKTKESKKVPFAERWNGSEWTIVSAPVPAGTGDSLLEEVSCSAASACAAVGRRGDSGDKPLAMRWNGTSLSIETTPSPSGAKGDVELHGVHCSSGTSCVAVGEYVSAGSPVPTETKTLVESWNGSAWSIQSSPNPAGKAFSYLSAVSCSASNACTGVGRSAQSGETFTVAERWNGSSWSLQSSLDPQPKTIARLDDVSCPATGLCLAIARDGYAGKAVVQRWNGSAWSNAVSLGGVTLSGIACPTTAFCVAVGEGSGGGSEPRSWTLSEASGTWTATSLTTPSPSGATNAFYRDVACSSTSACTAVGSYSAMGTKPLAMRWNGTSWTIQTTPTPSGEEGNHGSLFGVSCGAASDCLAVGEKIKEGRNVPFAERWNGSEWTIVAAPVPAGTGASLLEEVSCSSVSACAAVGRRGDSGDKPLAMRWNGSTLSIETTPSPAGAKGNVRLHGVHCSSGTSCVAVGEYVSAITEQWGVVLDAETRTLVERWNGSEWTIQASPNPAGKAFSYLNAVSCATPAACTGVGVSTQGDETFTAALRYG